MPEVNTNEPVETPPINPPIEPYTGETMTPPPLTPPKPKREAIKSALSTIGILLLAPIIAILLTTFVFQSYEVDGPSMETSLQHRDRLIILKTPRTWARITGHSYIPPRGEIIVFTKRGLVESGQSRDKQLIKRVVGLPGERVVVEKGLLTVYNNEYPDGFQPDKTFENAAHISEITPGEVDITVGDNEVFVVGDNRANSLDSRTFGTVSTADIVGKLTYRILPLSKIDKF